MSIKLKDTHFTCTVCGNHATLFDVNEAHTQEDFSRRDIHYRNHFADHFSLCVIGSCRKCFNVLIAKGWFDAGDDGHPYGNLQIVHPTAVKIPDSLPKHLAVSYISMMKHYDSDYDSFITLARRMLELICNEQGANGASLAPKLASLKASATLPATIFDVAEILKEYGNGSTHGTMKARGIHQKYVKEIIDIVISYVYNIPSTRLKAHTYLMELKGFHGLIRGQKTEAKDA